MNKPPVFPYTTDMDQCGLCDKRLQSTIYLGHYLIADRGAIAYPVCAMCGTAYFSLRLSREALTKLDAKMEKRAIECGLALAKQGATS